MNILGAVMSGFSSVASAATAMGQQALANKGLMDYQRAQATHEIDLTKTSAELARQNQLYSTKLDLQKNWELARAAGLNQSDAALALMGRTPTLAVDWNGTRLASSSAPTFNSGSFATTINFSGGNSPSNFTRASTKLVPPRKISKNSSATIPVKNTTNSSVV